MSRLSRPVEEKIRCFFEIATSYVIKPRKKLEMKNGMQEINISRRIQKRGERERNNKKCA